VVKRSKEMLNFIFVFFFVDFTSILKKGNLSIIFQIDGAKIVFINIEVGTEA
jgi:hypothetical protein